MKVDELRVLEADELGGRLKAARRELYELRFKHAVGQLENSSQISKVRHDIARIMTVLSERELGIVIVPHAAPEMATETATATATATATKPRKPARKEFEDDEQPAAQAEETTETVDSELVAEAVPEPEPATKPKRAVRKKPEKDA
jgi:large subunit ribosomal protein L29